MPHGSGVTPARLRDEVIAHLAGLGGAKVTVTLEVAAEIPDGGSRSCGSHGHREQPDAQVHQPGL